MAISGCLTGLAEVVEVEEKCLDVGEEIVLDIFSKGDGLGDGSLGVIGELWELLELHGGEGDAPGKPRRSRRLYDAAVGRAALFSSQLQLHKLWIII